MVLIIVAMDIIAAGFVFRHELTAFSYQPRCPASKLIATMAQDKSADGRPEYSCRFQW
jgi:hypothetical protein